MKKILKNTLALATIATCTLGFVGCGEDNDKDKVYTAENAYVDVYNQMGMMATNLLSGMDGATLNEYKNTLNIDFGFKYNLKTNTNGEMDESEFKLNLKGLIQTYFGSTHQLYAALDVQKGDKFETLLSAYLKDDLNDNVYTSLNDLLEPGEVVTAEMFEKYKDSLYVNEANFVKKLDDVEYTAGKFYKEVDGDYDIVADEVQPEGVQLYIRNDYTKVADDAEFSQDIQYYVLTGDYIYAYLNANLAGLNSFEQLTVKPADWEEYYTRYYHNVDHYSPISGAVAPEFAENKYYKVGEGTEFSVVLLTEKPEDWDTNFAFYYEWTSRTMERVSGETAPEFTSGVFYKNEGFDVRDLADGDLTIGEFFAMMYDSKSALKVDYIKFLASLVPETEITALEEGDIKNPNTDEDGLANALALIEMLPNMDFNTFKLLLSNEDGTCDWTFNGNKDSSGNVTFSMTSTTSEKYSDTITLIDNVKVDFIAHANGTIEIVIKNNSVQKNAQGVEVENSTVDLSVKLSYEKKFDKTLIPTDLEEYGELELVESKNDLF